MGYKVKRLTEGLIHKNFVIISAGGSWTREPPPSIKGERNGENWHRDVHKPKKGGIPSLKYGPVPSPLSSLLPPQSNLSYLI